MPRSVSQSHAKSLLVVTVVLVDQELSCLNEIRKDIIFNILKLFEHIFGLSLKHVLLIWDRNSIHPDASKLLNSIQELLISVVEESDANPRLSSSCSTS